MTTPHPIPAAALTRHLAIVGKTGSGKSYTSRGFVERLLDEGRRVVILDYTGVWSGLRASADGRRGAYPIVIFGGEHADVPLPEHAGPEVASLVAGGNRPAIVDLDGMSIGAQQRFVTAFLEDLYKLNKAPLHLVIEEADEFAPQTGAPGAERMIGAVCRIFQRGRSKGFRAIAITQRPANLHKRVLTQCNALVAMRLVAPQDRKAIAEWIRGHADDETGRRVVDSLPKLARGEGWMWAPEQDVLARVAFPRIATYDSMRAPEDGAATGAPAGWAEVDLDAIRAEMAEAVADAETNDPKRLKAEIARLLALAKGSSAGADDISAAEKRGYEAGRKDGRTEQQIAHVQAVLALQNRVRAALDAPDPEGLAPAKAVQHSASTRARRLTAEAALRAEPAPAKRHGIAERDAVSGPERSLLAALAWWAAVGQPRPSRAMACAIAGWRVTSGHVKNVAGSLRTKGLIDYPSDGRLTLTASGRGEVAEPDTQGRPVADYVRDTLSGPQVQVFDALLGAPRGLDRATLCDRIGWNATSGHVKNVLGSMRSMEIVEYPSAGSVRLVDWIFGTDRRR